MELVSKDKFEAWLQMQDPRTQQLLAFKVGPLVVFFFPVVPVLTWQAGRHTLS